MRHRYRQMLDDKQIDDSVKRIEERINAQRKAEDLLRTDPPIKNAMRWHYALAIKFTKTGEGSPLIPTQGHDGDAGWDLYTSRPCKIEPNSFVDVHCDICMELPAGYWARITGRSSTLRKYGMLVAEGVIDNGYRGELFTGIWNLTNAAITIPVHSRLAQLIPHALVSTRWVEVADLSQSSRGTAGFGSTGRGA